MTYCGKRRVLVKRMDEVITSLNNEELIESWLVNGCPDCSTEEDYEWFAENGDEFLDLVNLFIKITKKAMKESEAIVK